LTHIVCAINSSDRSKCWNCRLHSTTAMHQ